MILNEKFSIKVIMSRINVLIKTELRKFDTIDESKSSGNL
jgi:hypothetical protein